MIRWGFRSTCPQDGLCRLTGAQAGSRSPARSRRRCTSGLSFSIGISESTIRIRSAGKARAPVWNQGQWDPILPARGNVVRMPGRTGQSRLLSVLTWANSARGAACSFYGMSAPQARFSKASDAFTPAFCKASKSQVRHPIHRSSRRPCNNTSAGSNQTSARSPWKRRGGWQTQGGLRRVTAIDIRAGLVSDSPDGSIKIGIGDTSLPLSANRLSRARCSGSTKEPGTLQAPADR